MGMLYSVTYWNILMITALIVLIFSQFITPIRSVTGFVYSLDVETR